MPGEPSVMVGTGPLAVPLPAPPLEPPQAARASAATVTAADNAAAFVLRE
jgi:hypothetical protein